MADISFSMARNGDAIDVLATGSQTVTEGTASPGAGDIEIRITGTAGWTKKELENALDTLWRFATDVNRSTTIIL